MELIVNKITKTLPKLKSSLGYSNDMAVPAIEKVVIAAGTGSGKNKEKLEVVMDRLAKITGQKPTKRPAKKSEAGFKLRQGDIIGAAVTLRGARMYNFLDRLFNIAIPRERDFRGIDKKAVDNMGNITIGFREHTIFPETSDEDIKDVFGFSVTIVSSAKNKKEAIELFSSVGLPFKEDKA